MPNYPAGGPKKLGVIVFALNMQFKAVKAVVVLSGFACFSSELCAVYPGWRRYHRYHSPSLRIWRGLEIHGSAAMTCHNCGHCGNIHRADSSVVTWCRRRRQHHTAPIVAVLSSLMPFTVGSAGQNGPRRVSSLSWTSHLGFSFLVSLPNVDGDDGNEIHPARRSLGKRAQWRWSRKHLKHRNIMKYC